MSFQEAFPEHLSVPPTLTGQTPLPATKLTAVRRQQLVDLARAYEIPIPAGATKDQILPHMITAEQQGMFRTQPKHLYYFHKAHRTSDMPYIPLPENPEMAVAPVSAPQEAAPHPRRRKVSDYHRKQSLLKDKGVNAFGMTKQAVNELAEEHGIS